MENEANFYTQALYDFDSQDIKFNKGDILKVLRRANNEWYFGNLIYSERLATASNISGIFPINYVSIFELPLDFNENNALFLAIYDFPQIEKGDLDFNRHELIIGKHQIDADWWYGHYLNNNLKYGIFPLTHVKKIEIEVQQNEQDDEQEEETNNESLLYQNNSNILDSHHKEINYKQAKVIEEFNTCDPNLKNDSFQYLDLRVGDIIFATYEIDSYWYEGENIEGKKGIFPKHCVEIQNENEGERCSILNRTQRQIYFNDKADSFNFLDDYITNLFKSITSNKEEKQSNSLYENSVLTPIDSESSNEYCKINSDSDSDEKKSDNVSKYSLTETNFVAQTSHTNGDEYYGVDNNETETLTLTNNNIEASSKQEGDYEIYNDIASIDDRNELNNNTIFVQQEKQKENLYVSHSNQDDLITLTEDKNTKVEFKPRPPPLPPKPEFLRRRSVINENHGSKFKENIMSRIMELKNLIEKDKNDDLLIDLSDEKTTNTDNQASKEKLKNEFEKLADIFVKMEPNHEFSKMLLEYKRNENVKHLTKDLKEKQPDENVKKFDLSARNNIINELVETEKNNYDILSKFYACFTDKSAEINKPEAFSTILLFSNLKEILQISLQFIHILDEEIVKNENEIKIGSCLLKCASDMQQYYAIYCRDHATTNELIKKYEGKKEINDYIKAKLEEIKDVVNSLDLNGILIKPVQRILKYSLFINQLLKKTPTDHVDYPELKSAASVFNQIGLFINEYKRRKDLILKYRNKIDNRNIIEKLTMNTIRKKSGRLGQRISTALGLYDQTVDLRFNYEEDKFRNIEREIKIFIKESNNLLTNFKEMLDLQINIADNLIKLYNDDEKNKNIICIWKKCFTDFINEIFDKFMKEVCLRIWTPLTDLYSAFEMPNKLIEKRFNKLLDYDRTRTDIEKNKINNKTKELNNQIVEAQKNYEALNAQLLDDLPILINKSALLLEICAKLFTVLFSNVLKDFKSNLISIEKSLELPLKVISFETIYLYLNNLEISKNNEKSNSLDKQASVDLLSQTQKQRDILKQKYEADKLYKVTQNIDSNERILQLGARAGEIVAVIKKSDPAGKTNIWFVDDGVSKGFLPANILLKISQENCIDLNTNNNANNISKKDDSNNNRKKPLVTTKSFDIPSSNPESSQIKEYCAALYDFNAIRANMLTIREGDILSVIEKQDRKGDKQWWLLESSDGNKGYVPYNYVALLN